MKKRWMQAAAVFAFFGVLVLCVWFADMRISYTVQADNSNLEERALQFLNQGREAPAQGEIRLYDQVDLGKERYVLMEYIQAVEPQLGRIKLEKGLNGRYKIVGIGYGGGNFREGVEENGKEKYYLFGGRNTYFAIAEIKAVLDGREYILDVPEGDHFLICTEVAPTTEDNHCDFEKLAFYNGSGEGITAQIPWN